MGKNLKERPKNVAKNPRRGKEEHRYCWYCCVYFGNKESWKQHCRIVHPDQTKAFYVPEIKTFSFNENKSTKKKKENQENVLQKKNSPQKNSIAVKKIFESEKLETESPLPNVENQSQLPVKRKKLSNLENQSQLPVQKKKFQM